MNFGLFEDAGFRRLLPLTWLRPCYELRCGRQRLIDKLRAGLSPEIHAVWTRPELRETALERLDLARPNPAASWCLVNARMLLTGSVTPPPRGVGWTHRGSLLAVTVPPEQAAELDESLFLDETRLSAWAERFELQPAPEQAAEIVWPWDLVQSNSAELLRECGPGGVHHGEVYPGVHLLNPSQIHIAAGTKIKPGVVLDAEEGPIHIDADVTIHPNAVIEGPCFIGRGSLVRAGAVLRGGTTVGPVCKVGGEIEASIIQGYTNKQHDGFLGHSAVGEWVNLGADTVTSDLKNTYGAIRVPINGVSVETGLHFVGSIIGDHTKTGIGTILPTGCVIGVAANIFTHRPAPRFVPSFAWLTDDGMTHYQIEKAIRIARIVMARRDVHLTDAEARLMQATCTLARQIEAAGWSAAH